MPRLSSLTPWEGRLAGCPTCGALPSYPCVVTTPSRLATLTRSRQYTPGGPLPECTHVHPSRVIAAKAFLQRVA